MKKMMIMAALAVPMLTMMSCGSSKQTSSAPNYQQNWQQQSETQRPTRKLREAEPCIELANENSAKMRAYGMGTSFDEATATEMAKDAARNEFAQMLKVSTEGASQNYMRNASQNMKSSAATIYEKVNTLVYAEEVANSVPIKTTTYDLSDGTVQIYVCMELRTPTDDINKKISNVLDREGLIENQYDRDQFIEKMKEQLKEYKEKRAAQE